MPWIWRPGASLQQQTSSPPPPPPLPPPSPPSDLYANLGFFQQWTFSFALPVIRFAERVVLQTKDLPEVAPLDEASVLTDRLETEWRKELLLHQIPQQQQQPQPGQGPRRNKTKKPSLWKALYRAHRSILYATAVMLTMEYTIMLAKPVLLRYLLAWLKGTLFPASEVGPALHWRYGYGFALLLAGLDFMQTIVHHTVFYLSIREGWRVRTSVMGLIYKKVLRLDSRWQSTNSTGRIVSMLANDTQRYEECSASLHFVWLSPLFALAGAGLLVLYVGWLPALVGCIAIVGVIPLQVWCGRQVGKARSKTAGLTDKRVKLMAEVLAGIQSVKAFVWEEPFHKVISQAREEERQSLAWAGVMRATTLGIFFFAPSLAAFVTFLTYWALGYKLELPLVFSVMTLLQTLRDCARWIPRSIEQVSEAHVSTMRIMPFLLLPEVEERGERGEKEGKKGDIGMNGGGVSSNGGGAASNGNGASASTHRDLNNEDEKDKDTPVVSIHDSDFSWFGNESPTPPPTTTTDNNNTYTIKKEEPHPPPELHLHGLSLAVKAGELLVVAGPVRSGKSTLLDAILGEVPCVRGQGVQLRQHSHTHRHTHTHTRLAYCSQQAWIQAGTIRDNILFGAVAHDDHTHTHTHTQIDEARYALALQACALDHDLNHWPQGDMTEIGESGVNLSGGQRARVALARAVYADADLYLLDDCLSAVDAAVSKHLFHECIRGVLREKAVILVTHQIQYLPYATRVCLLGPGGGMVVEECKAWKEVQAAVPDWQGFVGEVEGEGEEEGEGGEGEGGGKHQRQQEEQEKETDNKDKPPQDNNSTTTNNTNTNTITPRLAFPTPTTNTTTYVASEDRREGHVQLDTYKSYLKSGGVYQGIAILLLLVLSQALLTLSDFWLKIWAGAEDQGVGSNAFYPRVYAILMAVCVVLGLLRADLFFRFSLRASSKLHDQALRAVLAAPLAFFNSNPRGRILNKFSKDLDNADDLFPFAAFDFLQSGMMCLAAVVVGCLAVPYLLVIVAPLLWFFRKYRREFVNTAREVKRLDAITKSPLYADVSSSLVGGKVIRAFDAQGLMQQRFLHKLDENGKCAYLFIILNRYLGFRLDVMCALFLTFLAVMAVSLVTSLDPGMLALSLTYALVLGGTFQWSIRQSAQTETLLTSVERLHYYTTLPSEEDEDKEERGEAHAHTHKYGPTPPPPWPHKGEINVENLHVRYRKDLPIVLKGINFRLPAGKKIGIVGRTGSGKSSFLSSFLRLNQIVDGDIRIDNIPLSTLKRKEARQAVSWIPQVPDLFAGTLRMNLDPFGVHSDMEIWQALEDVHLSGLTTSLDMPVAEGGGDLSVGSRQLLSFARAVLLRRKVILMDEATASIDYVLDQQIQHTIKTAPAFQGCTCVVIAHRINTVLDSDLILVFADGKCVEQGSPEELLAREGGSMFAEMVKEGTRMVSPVMG